MFLHTILTSRRIYVATRCARSRSPRTRACRRSDTVDKNDALAASELTYYVKTPLPIVSSNKKIKHESTVLVSWQPVVPTDFKQITKIPRRLRGLLLIRERRKADGHDPAAHV